MSILWSSMIFPARNLGFDGFPMAHRVAEVVATEVTQNTGATFPWFGFFPLFFWKKLGFDGCWIWTNMGLKVRFYVEFDIYVIIIYMCVCMYMCIYIYTWRLKESDRFLVAGFWLFPLGWTLWVMGRSRSTTAVWHHIFAACFYIHCKDRYIFAMDCNIYIYLHPPRGVKFQSLPQE